MVNKSDDTEQIILDAAQNVFVKKGLYGARMQEIADEAGINKALLHYYFRNKEQLFEAIFKATSSRFIPVLFSILNEESELDDKVRKVVEHYLDEFATNTF